MLRPMEKALLIAVLVGVLLLTAAFMAWREPHPTYTGCADLDLTTGVLTPCDEAEERPDWSPLRTDED